MIHLKTAFHEDIMISHSDIIFIKSSGNDKTIIKLKSNDDVIVVSSSFSDVKNLLINDSKDFKEGYAGLKIVQ